MNGVWLFFLCLCYSALLCLLLYLIQSRRELYSIVVKLVLNSLAVLVCPLNLL